MQGALLYDFMKDKLCTLMLRGNNREKETQHDVLRNLVQSHLGPSEFNSVRRFDVHHPEKTFHYSHSEKESI